MSQLIDRKLEERSKRARKFEEDLQDLLAREARNDVLTEDEIRSKLKHVLETCEVYDFAEYFD